MGSSLRQDHCYFRVSIKRRADSHGRPAALWCHRLLFRPAANASVARTDIGDGCKKQRLDDGAGRDWRLGCHGKTRSPSLMRPSRFSAERLSERCATFSFGWRCLQGCCRPGQDLKAETAKKKCENKARRRWERSFRKPEREVQNQRRRYG
jgi:hypothetical protein